MPGLPTHCAKCGLVFISRQFGASDSINVTFRGIRETCPNCGAIAHGVDGTFDFVGNAIKVHPGAPPRTIEILSTLQEALRDLQAGKADDIVLENIAKASPELARAIKREQLPIRQGFFLLILTLLANCSTNANLNWNQLIDQVRVYSTGAEPYPRLGNQSPRSQQGTPPTGKPNRADRRKAESSQRKVQVRKTGESKPSKPGR